VRAGKFSEAGPGEREKWFAETKAPGLASVGWGITKGGEGKKRRMGIGGKGRDAEKISHVSME